MRVVVESCSTESPAHEFTSNDTNMETRNESSLPNLTADTVAQRNGVDEPEPSSPPQLRHAQSRFAQALLTMGSSITTAESAASWLLVKKSMEMNVPKEFLRQFDFAACEHRVQLLLTEGSVTASTLEDNGEEHTPQKITTWWRRATRPIRRWYRHHGSQTGVVLFTFGCSVLVASWRGCSGIFFGKKLSKLLLLHTIFHHHVLWQESIKQHQRRSSSTSH